MQLDFTLSFTDSQWVCYNDALHIVADSLDEIDDVIKKHLDNTYSNGEFRIKMFFDFDRFPRWHRQYMPHYFNRDFTYKPKLITDEHSK